MNGERKVVQLNVEDILPNRFQPRIKFNEDAILELSESIKEHGVIQPIVVRQIDDKYEIIAGERRYKASLMAGKQTIPAIITDLNDRDSAEVALIENVQRKDLTPIEEAVSYKTILDMGYLTQEALADKLGKTQSTIANKLRLLNLDEDVQEALLEEKISERHARSLLRLPVEMQAEVAHKIIQERMTVRKTDEYIKKLLSEREAPQPIKPKGVTVKLKVEPVLDDILEMLKEEKAGVNMNETQNMNNNGLPQQPIIEEIEDVIPQTPVANNPGFMDVDKIEQQATDINVQRPTANMDDLLKSDPNIAPEPQVVSTPDTVESSEDDEDDAESLLRPGKFFTFADMEKTEATPKEEPTSEVSSLFQESTPISNVQETSSSSASASFGAEPVKSAADTFDFDQFFKTTSAPQPVQENTESNFATPQSIPTITPESLHPEMANSAETNMQNTTAEIPAIPANPTNPVNPTNNITFNGVPNVEDVLEEPEELDLTGIQLSGKSEPNTEVSIVNTTPSQNNFFQFGFDQPSPTPEVQPAVDHAPETKVEPMISQEPITPVSSPQTSVSVEPNNNGIIEINPFGPVPTMSATNVSEEKVQPIEPISSVQPVSTAEVNTMPETIKEQPVAVPQSQPTQTYVAGDLKMVINTIRECAATIEKYGFIVDTEELDFEDTYEVTFKIEKK